MEIFTIVILASISFMFFILSAKYYKQKNKLERDRIIHATGGLTRDDTDVILAHRRELTEFQRKRKKHGNQF